jgi:hypothetical protein
MCTDVNTITYNLKRNKPAKYTENPTKTNEMDRLPTLGMLPLQYVLQALQIFVTFNLMFDPARQSCF